jgi:hypothetical protein
MSTIEHKTLSVSHRETDGGAGLGFLPARIPGPRCPLPAVGTYRQARDLRPYSTAMECRSWPRHNTPEDRPADSVRGPTGDGG